ncbi:hypothetical protein G6F50_014423 [Rhizopus delemar]|uniref:KfrA N-terminal DNA-binding domain-containing protein n=1 Tax=Rhizopus delemar TaxID=936053 RepID=A0A9P6Y651_9FUNG|nr:hypothetical protein G6F50_014423 [Rhizopus delemar]
MPYQTWPANSHRSAEGHPMAKGISELDVHQAADDIIAAGERPTVERIRAHLGTGSPNTVTRWLETWWQTVGFRLRQRAIEAAVPGIPERARTGGTRAPAGGGPGGPDAGD